MSISRAALRVALCCVAAGSIYACGDEDLSEPGDTVASATIGPDGGTMTGDGVSITVSPGALSEAVTITVRRADPSELGLPEGDLETLINGTLYDIGPDGLTFDAPVQIALDYDENRLPQDAHEWLLGMAIVADDVSFVPSSTDTAANVVTGTTTHFTYFSLLYEPAVYGVNEVIAVTDSVAVQLGPAPVADSAAELITVSDSVAIELGPTPMSVDASESIVVTDSVAVELGPIPSTEAVVYIAVESDNQVVVFDPGTGTVADSVTVPQWPWPVAVSPDGSEVYTASRNDGSVTIIDASTITVAATIASVANDPFDMAVSPDGETLYVLDNNSGRVAIMDAVSRSVTGDLLGAPSLSDAIALDPTGNTAYVVANDTAVAFDVGTESAVDTVTGTFQSADAAVTADGTELVLTDFDNARLVFVDLATFTVTAAVTGISDPRGMALTSDGATAWVAARGSSELVPVDVASRTAGTPIPLPFSPYWVAVSSDGTTGYVTEGRGGTRLAVVDLAAGSATTVTLGDGPAQIRIAP